ncbi:MAG TPA: FAD-binding oxidoreductase [Hyphomonadaceae bacterium]|jgi:L-gulonolactone oxidase|nr:FAD-binding oxidoreductase [Hyphomonadaceae bacterium]
MATPYYRNEKFTSWGRVLRAPHQVAKPYFPDELPELVRGLAEGGPGLAVGLRRSYGDSNLNPDGRVIDMSGLDRLISFDRTTGIVRAEAGISLSQLLRVLVPAGFFLPTTPGTRFVTLGGAIANDVHGKNHHSAGNFGNAVTRLALLRTDGSGYDVGPGDPMFHAIIGGLGLTGVIVWAEFQAVRIPSSTLDAEDTAFEHVSDYFAIAAEKKETFEHTMAWIDCMTSGAQLGRGILSSANWYAHGDLRAHKELPKKKMPLDAPGFALNPLSIRAFNSVRHDLKTMRQGPYKAHYEPFLYPLDAITDWNRLYGSKGFYQYQCVVPPAVAKDATIQLLKTISASGQGSFLAVLKDFGAIPAQGLMSFPMEGTTLALDFQNKGEETLRLMSDLDAIVSEAGGRLYPAKDGRISGEMFRSGFPKFQEFSAHIDPGLSSAFWKRVSQ